MKYLFCVFLGVSKSPKTTQLPPQKKESERMRKFHEKLEVESLPSVLNN